MVAIVLCLATAFFLPRLRTVVEDIGSSIGIEQLQELENLTVPSDLLDEFVIPTQAPDLCAEGVCLSFPAGDGA